MHIKTIASAIALATSIALSGAAFAQTAAASTNVNGLTVTEVDLPQVQAYCEQLAGGMEKDESTDKSPAMPNSTAAVDTNAGTEGNTDKDDSQPTIDLGQITLEGCVEAGLVAKTM